MKTIIYVSKTDPSADCSTIQEALDLLSERTPKEETDTPASIRLDAGVYYEKLHIKIPNLTLEGDSANKTVIRYDDYAYEMACFDHCTIHSLMRDESASVQGYVSAASTPKDADYGFIFSHCTLTSDCPPHSVFLGRPWRDYAQTVYLNCSYGAHIHPSGFHDWGKTHAHETILFAEYACVLENTVSASVNIAGQKLSGQTSSLGDILATNPFGHQKRAAFVRQLSPEEAAHYEELLQQLRSACDSSIFR